MIRAKLTRACFVMLAISLVAPAAGVRAENFTFNIPVALYNLSPKITFYGCQVFAEVYPSAGDYLPGANSGKQIGLRIADVPFSGNGYIGTMTLKFDAIPGKRAADATFYAVELRCRALGFNPDGASTAANKVMAQGGPYPYDPAKPFVWHITGTLHSASPYKKPLAKQPPVRFVPTMPH